MLVHSEMPIEPVCLDGPVRIGAERFHKMLGEFTNSAMLMKAAEETRQWYQSERKRNPDFYVTKENWNARFKETFRTADTMVKLAIKEKYLGENDGFCALLSKWMVSSYQTRVATKQTDLLEILISMVNLAELTRCKVIMDLYRKATEGKINEILNGNIISSEYPINLVMRHRVEGKINSCWEYLVEVQSVSKRIGDKEQLLQDRQRFMQLGRRLNVSTGPSERSLLPDLLKRVRELPFNLADLKSQKKLVNEEKRLQRARALVTEAHNDMFPNERTAILTQKLYEEWRKKQKVKRMSAQSIAKSHPLKWPGVLHLEGLPFNKPKIVWKALDIFDALVVVEERRSQKRVGYVTREDIMFVNRQLLNSSCLSDKEFRLLSLSYNSFDRFGGLLSFQKMIAEHNRKGLLTFLKRLSMPAKYTSIYLSVEVEPTGEVRKYIAVGTADDVEKRQKTATGKSTIRLVNIGSFRLPQERVTINSKNCFPEQHVIDYFCENAAHQIGKEMFKIGSIACAVSLFQSIHRTLSEYLHVSAIKYTEYAFRLLGGIEE